MINNPSSIQITATVCFILAIVHTFSVKFFQKCAHKYKEGSVLENVFHFLGEIEVVFGLWAAVFILIFAVLDSYVAAVQYIENSRFTEPILVFILMTICSTKPILYLANKLIEMGSLVVPLRNPLMRFYFSALVFGPVLGSFITEPAAMTVTALVLLNRFYNLGITQSLKYATLGLLFVNISIGGVFTHYAAPPVLMVASKWNWDMAYMFTHFGWKALIAMTVSTTGILYFYKKEFSAIAQSKSHMKHGEHHLPLWLVIIHVVFLGLIILNHHHSAVMVALFLFFLGIVDVTKEYQSPINLKSPMLVAFFLGGLVVLGGLQSWWLEPLLSRLSAFTLYIGSTGLTAVTDNAAITFLGSQVEGLSEASKYALVSGAVVGGGLTVIANAPNPAGYSILNSTFGQNGIGALDLFKGALWPTTVALICFWVF